MGEIKRIKTLIIGATFAGIGLALRMKGQAFVIEPTAGAGNEFIAAFRKAKISVSDSVSAEAEELRNEAFERNAALDEGGMHWPGFAPILCRIIQSQTLDVRFLTRVVEAKELEGGLYEVVFIDASGLTTIHAESILDTTSFCDIKPSVATSKVRSQHLNALIHFPGNPAAVPPAMDEYPMHRGRFASEWAVSCALEVGESWPSARRKLIARWNDRPDSLQGWQLATIADTFDVTIERGMHRLAPNMVWLPSASYADPIAAYDACLDLPQGVQGL